LILKQGINLGYRVYLMSEPTIYAYPERDKDGKMESVGHQFASGGIYMKAFKDRQKVLAHLNKYHPEIIKNVKNFVEFKITILDGKAHDDKNPNQYAIIKFYLNDESKNYEIIDKSQARYIRKNSEKQGHLFGWFYTEEMGIYDTKEEKYMVTLTYLGMKSISFMNYIRKNIFWLQSGSGSGRAMLRVNVGAGYQNTKKEMIKDFFTNYKN